MIELTITKAIGGYTILYGDLYYVATSREGVGKIIAKICTEAFGETREGSDEEQ